MHLVGLADLPPNIFRELGGTLADDFVRNYQEPPSDSDLPFAPYSGGSAMALSLSGAIQDAVGNLVRAFLEVVADDE